MPKEKTMNYSDMDIEKLWLENQALIKQLTLTQNDFNELQSENRVLKDEVGEANYQKNIWRENCQKQVEENKQLKEHNQDYVIALMRDYVSKKSLPCLLETIWKSQEYQDFEETKNPEDTRVDGKIFIEFLKNKRL